MKYAVLWGILLATLFKLASGICAEDSAILAPVRYVTPEIQQPDEGETKVYRAQFCENQSFLNNSPNFTITVGLPDNTNWRFEQQVVLRAVPGPKYNATVDLPPDKDVTAWVCNPRVLPGMCRPGAEYPCTTVHYEQETDYYFYVTASNLMGTSFFLTMSFGPCDKHVYGQKSIGIQSVPQSIQTRKNYRGDVIKLVQVYNSGDSKNHKSIKQKQFGCWEIAFCKEALEQEKKYRLRVIVEPYEVQSEAAFQSFLCKQFTPSFKKCSSGTKDLYLLDQDNSNQNVNLLEHTYDPAKNENSTYIVSVYGNGGNQDRENKAGITVFFKTIDE